MTDLGAESLPPLGYAGAEREWVTDSFAFAKESGRPLEGVLVEAAFGQHREAIGNAQAVDFMRNTVARLSRKLRDAGLSTA